MINDPGTGVSRVISRKALAVCDTLSSLRRIGRFAHLVGDGKWLNVSEASERLGVSDSSVRNYIREDLLYAWSTAGGHRRIDPEIVGELGAALHLPPAERDEALDELRRKVRARQGRDRAGFRAVETKDAEWTPRTPRRVPIEEAREEIRRGLRRGGREAEEAEQALRLTGEEHPRQADEV